MLNTVLFDLDGTLVQHGHVLLPTVLDQWKQPRPMPAIYGAFAHQIAWFYDHIIDAEQQGWVDELWQRFYGRILDDLGIPDQTGERSLQVRDFFAEHPVPPLFDDVRPVIGHLHQAGWKLGIITQRDRSGVDRFLGTHGLAEIFPVIIAGDDGLGRKPDVAPFLAAVAQLESTPAQAVFVGDRIDDDCEGALNAGLGAFLIDRDNVRDNVQDNVHSPANRNGRGYTALTHLDQLLAHLSAPIKSGVTLP